MAVSVPIRKNGTRVNVRRRRLGAVAVLAAFVAAVGVASADLGGVNPFGSGEVGQTYNGALLLPTNQWISPIGTRIEDQHGRIVSSTLSPDGQYMAALTWNEFTGYLTIIDLKTGKIVQEEGAYPNTLDPAAGEPGEEVAADGPLYSPDGKTLWIPQTGDIAKFTVDPETGTVSEKVIVKMPPAANGPAPEDSTEAKHPGEAEPSGMALSPDGSKLYVALNGSNALGVINTATNEVEREIPVGNAPRQVVIDGNTAYVSNEGGHPARPGETTNLSDGTPIVSSPVTGAASTGTVSVINLATDKQEQEIPVGLEPTALHQSGSALFVANSNDDSISVIDTATNTVVQTTGTNPLPGANVGSYANAITMSDPEHVLVSIGRDNAIAVYRYSGLSRHHGGRHWRGHWGRTTPLEFEGLLPTDWYPVQVQPDPALGHGEIVVTNDRGIGDRGPQAKICKGTETSPAPECVKGYNTYDDTGTVTMFNMPAEGELAGYTKTVFTDNDWNNVPAINGGVGDTVPGVIPRRIGGHSPIKHVFVIVKENRTYDQVLGDLGEGNSDPELAQFGQKVTPNQHALAKRFGDLDDFYDEGTLSADGHNWIVQAEASDYVEKEFGAFYRSYPAEGGDALAYQRDGFLWNAAEKAGLSVRDFGEYNRYITGPGNGGDWKEWYEDSQILEGKKSGPLPIPINEYKTSSDIPSLNAISDPYYPRFDLEIPDQYRYDIWKAEFEHEESSGAVPNLTLIWLPDDHTGGAPDPVAQAADNDLAMGRIVETISHSKVWKESAIFGVEDDTQNGVDHVDGHRGPAFVISPYAKGGVEGEYETQLNMVRTVEQILGIQPMNQEDYAAEPMYGAFTETPNFEPYTAAPNEIPLTLGVEGFPAVAPAAAPAQGSQPVQGEVPTSMQSVYNAWMSWKRQQSFLGKDASPDSAKPVLFNRFDWYSAHDWKVAYPGDPKIYLPDEVPGNNLPAAFIGD
ncbi:MAG TPA: bifunctional YncE family protein/alkaline phosphatase family protein [Solirubrobacteraceae bacterium]|nr:bifunctional YncE family protein/alkaline phosphatase family protein [Solirubrobacteraceae bacterium]